MPVHNTYCRRCGELSEVEGDETVCKECQKAVKCGFHDKNQLEEATVEYMISKHVFTPQLGF